MTIANLTKREHIAAQLLANLTTIEGMTDAEIVDLSIKLTDDLLKQLNQFPALDTDDTLPDPAWDYATLWGILCTTEARVKALKCHLSQFEEGTPEIDQETYHQLMGILESVNGAMSCINVRPRKNHN
jgi:hypothetical protein